jgi:hypothetical protein
MLRITKEQYLNSYKLNNPVSCQGIYEEQAERLIDLVEFSTKKFKIPMGFHLRIRLSDDYPIQAVLDRLCKAYSRPGKRRKKENTFRPLYLWTMENDPNDDGNHYHIAFIIDLKKAKMASVHALLAKLEKCGLIADKKVIEATIGGNSIYHLIDRRGKELYIEWLSYICKVRTKENLRGRTWGSSRIQQTIVFH